MATYKLTRSDFIMRVADGAHFPPDPRNADFRDYQAWLAAGNTPDPVDMVVPDITKRQALLWLWANLQKSDQDVLNAIATIADPGQRQEALIEWQYRGVFQRAHPLFDKLGVVLALSAAELDGAFGQAAML